MCCTRLAEIQDANKSPFWHHRTTLSGCIFAADACIDNGKHLLNIDTSPACPHNMVNFGLLTAEISWRVWGTPTNFTGFHVLAALAHGTLVVGVSQTLRRWTEGVTYIRQGDHHVGHWPTFYLVIIKLCFKLRSTAIWRIENSEKWKRRYYPAVHVLLSNIITFSILLFSLRHVDVSICLNCCVYIHICCFITNVNAQRDCRPAEYRWRPLLNAAKFGWCSLLECRAVTVPRRETRWNLLGCPKLANRSQPLVGRSSP